jgi:hypothetical protein
MTAPWEAAERRLDAFLAAAVGDDVPTDLAVRVAARLREAPPRRLSWLAAAVLISGGAVVAGVELLQRHTNAATQDPQPLPEATQPLIELTTAAVRAAAAPMVDLDVDRPAAPELLRTLALTKTPVLLDAGLGGTHHSRDVAIPWRAAVALLAKDLGAGVAECGPFVVLTPGTPGLVYDAPLSLVTPARDLRTFARTFAARAGFVLVLAEELHGRVRCDLDGVSWRDALDVLATQLGAVVEGCGTTLALRPKPAAGAVAPRTRFDFTAVPAPRVIDAVVHVAGGNLVVDGSVTSALTVRAESVPAAAVLAAVARATATELLDLREGKLHYLARSHAADATAPPITAEAVDLRTFASLVLSAADTSIAVPKAAPGRLSAFVSGRSSLLDLARGAAAATGHRVVVADDGSLRIE